ncbi:glutamate receptor-interacting protein 2 isoform X2 [Contarinia nasturtii]|nr:glutamate receptor-interacting protein 2 isoform X2 [Contarinia nasturtii]
MSPAQSEDSGLAADRGTTYATISLPRENAQAMGIVFLERLDLSYPPIISALNTLGPAADFLAPGDRIHQIDGISTIGLTNNHVLNLLLNGDQPAVVEIEYCLPEYISQNSVCVTTKLAQITVERENGCLGLTLRGGGDFPLLVTNVRPHGPVFKVNRIKPGDRLLRVDNISLVNKSLLEAQQILKCGHTSGLTNLTIEYDVSVMQSVEFSLGPLLIEIERPMNEKLGIILSNYSNLQASTMDTKNDICPSGIFIASILAASIADRCGALSVGDQILSIDETIIENTSYSPEDVMSFLNGPSDRGFTQLQILPVHAIQRKGYNTLDSRKTPKQKRYIRKGSVGPSGSSSSPLYANAGLCHAETSQVMLDCSQGSGIVIGTKIGQGYAITHIIPDSAADRCGCIQIGDRLMSINKLYNLDANTIRQILGDNGGSSSAINTYQVPSPYWVELEIEFDMFDSVIPSQGVFSVKLAKVNKSDLGITVNATAHGSFIISEVKRGSPAHRTGSLRAGDILLAVDSQQLQHYNVDALLKDRSKEFTTLTINRNALPDFLFDAQQRFNGIYSNGSGSSKNDYNIYGSGTVGKYLEGKNVSFEKMSSLTNTMKAKSCQPDYYHTKEQDKSRQTTPFSSATMRHPFLCKTSEPPCFNRNTTNDNTNSMTTELPDEDYNNSVPFDLDYRESFDSSMPPPMDIHNSTYGTHQLVVNVRLEINGGPLGITLSGSEDSNKPILISAVLDGGIAQSSHQINVGDCLLAINGESVQGKPLSHATKLLQNLGNIVDLKISRNINDYENQFVLHSDINPQAVYAKVQRRPRTPLYGNGVNTNSVEIVSNSSKEDGNRYSSFHVTLYKDKVYDDYGFSVSDGLYERGVYINRIRSGGPADTVGLLKPFDRIVQVNDTKTKDFDCCLTVPLIASAGDKIELIVQRPISE